VLLKIMFFFLNLLMFFKLSLNVLKYFVQTLLGEHSNLVNLDDLVTSGKPQGSNKFQR